MGQKQAIQLGAAPGEFTGGGSPSSSSSGSFPGMTFSPSGTTATINKGAGVVKKGKPGRSKRPIELTTLQRFNRAKRKLKSIGAPLRTGTKAQSEESHPVLEELKAKYGSSSSDRREAAAAAAK